MLNNIRRRSLYRHFLLVYHIRCIPCIRSLFIWISKDIPFLVTLTESVRRYRIVSLASLLLSLKAIFASMACQNLNTVSLGVLVFDVELVSLDVSVLPSAILSVRISHQGRL